MTHCFHQEVGITPIDYLNRCRVDAAKSMLVRGGKTIGEVAATAGFASSSQFSRVFHQYTGISPRSIRAPATPTNPIFFLFAKNCFLLGKTSSFVLLKIKLLLITQHGSITYSQGRLTDEIAPHIRLDLCFDAPDAGAGGLRAGRAGAIARGSSNGRSAYRVAWLNQQRPQQATTKITLEIWDTGTEYYQWVEDVAIPMFKEMHPNVEIIHTRHPLRPVYAEDRHGGHGG